MTQHCGVWCWLLCDVMVEIQSRSVRKHDDDVDTAVTLDGNTGYNMDPHMVEDVMCVMGTLRPMTKQNIPGFVER
jgi:hypothetical protein